MHALEVSLPRHYDRDSAFYCGAIANLHGVLRSHCSWFVCDAKIGSGRKELPGMNTLHDWRTIRPMHTSADDDDTTRKYSSVLRYVTDPYHSCCHVFTTTRKCLGYVVISNPENDYWSESMTYIVLSVTVCSSASSSFSSCAHLYCETMFFRIIIFRNSTV